jgi:Domain of unknown function (DUF1905)/Bacteriocin-protection, YdeI or OmpD-Associated
MNPTPLTNKQYLLERIPGKGGWTYARIDDIPREKDVPFGMVRVKGSIDGFEIDTCSIMPMGDGGLFLPVRAEIRKAIKKEEGDYVHIILYKDDEPYKIPEALQTRLEEEGVYKHFLQRKQFEQRLCARWIYSAKRPETVNERIIKTIYRLRANQNII